METDEASFWRRLTDQVGARHIRPPVPTGKRQLVPPNDPAVAMTSDEFDESASTTAFITYTGSDGEESSRVITFRRIQGQYGKPERIGAYCHVRNAFREFRLDRIGNMFCTVTGEELDPVEHCLELHRNGALKIEDVILTRLMRVLTFMARCDGEFHDLEHKVLENILGRYFRFFGGDEASYDCAVLEAPRLAPSGDEFIKALRYLTRVSQAQQICRFALDSCAEIIDADGTHREDEIRWSIEVSDILKRKASA